MIKSENTTPVRPTAEEIAAVMPEVKVDNAMIEVLTNFVPTFHFMLNRSAELNVPVQNVFGLFCFGLEVGRKLEQRRQEIATLESLAR